MQNYPNTYLEPELIGKVNAWEYYFRQPLGISLETAYNGDNVILSNGNPKEPRPDDSSFFFDNKDGVLTEWRMLVKLGLLKVQPNLYKEIMSLREKLFAPNERVLGVLLRGTDYVARKPYGHPIQPPIEYALSKIIEKLNEWRCNKIFLATEDTNILQIFKNVFKDTCIVLDRLYIRYNEKEPLPLRFYHIDRKNDYYLLGKDYLAQMVILSTCNCLVAGRTSGTVGAMMMGNFENLYTFNFGRYGKIGLD